MTSQAGATAPSARYIIGVDVGGTFTDVFFLDQISGTCAVAKVPSTRDDQSRGFMQGIHRQVGDGSAVATIVHGTTVGTNALLERKGARTGIITTDGFRDVLEMRRRDRPTTWGLWGRFEPIVPRNLRIEVPERTLADGTVHTPVDLAAVAAAARTLLERGAESVCIVFINAYADNRNERQALACVRAIWPNPHVAASFQILPEIREFERTSTTALNAYLQPLIGDYLHRLEGALSDDGFHEQILIVQSNGGVMTAETARRLPIRTTLSGPAAGVTAAAYIAGEAGYPNVITCDMGGTSFDVSLIAGGRSTLSPQTSIDFGLTVRIPMIEITTIGAGGGSIAWVDRSGLLQIGPESAGSSPGPACYGQGNDRPTVTDANVVLGRIDAEHPIGGQLQRLDTGSARRAIEHHVAEPLGLETMAAAEAIVRVANSRMAGAIRLVSIERGHDPKQFTAMPFGGGGALHAGALIKEVGLHSALVPRYPGINSALGCAIADMQHDFVQTMNGVLDTLDVADLDRRMRLLAEQGLELLQRAGVVFDGTETVFALDMCYQGQTHTVDVTLPLDYAGGGTGVTREIVRSAFVERYRTAYGRPLEGLAVRVLNVRVSTIGRRPRFNLERLVPNRANIDPATDPAADLASVPAAGIRRIWADGAWHDAAIYQRLSLPVGADIQGPAILEQPDSTTFIDADLQGSVDRYGNLLVTRKNGVSV